jgi:hypothetical protein
MSRSLTVVKQIITEKSSYYIRLRQFPDNSLLRENKHVLGIFNNLWYCPDRKEMPLLTNYVV